jgi:sugar lactone lactonase YvrE
MVVRNAVDGRSTIDSLRVLPGGDIVIADYQGDQLARVDSMGRRRKLADMNSPNKLTIGPGGRIYTVGLEGDVWVSDPDNGKTISIAHINGHLRGLSFSLDYKTLYASDAQNGLLHAIGLNADGTYQAPRVWVRNIGPGPDGMATDACGNVYVADHNSASLHRVSPTGQVEVVANLNNGPTSAVGFGSGQHGWDAKNLYTVNADRGGMYELKVGIGAAPPPPP